MDGSDWLEKWAVAAPPIQMADEGHDIYMSSWRGTEFARGHETIDEKTDPQAFWDFAKEDLGRDLVANIRTMRETAFSKEKGYLVGYSMGTHLSMIAMA